MKCKTINFSFNFSNQNKFCYLYGVTVKKLIIPETLSGTLIVDLNKIHKKDKRDELLDISRRFLDISSKKVVAAIFKESENSKIISA